MEHESWLAKVSRIWLKYLWPVVPWIVLGWATYLNHNTIRVVAEINNSLDEMRHGCGHFLDDNLESDSDDEPVEI